jgi:hypothetical protein
MKRHQWKRVAAAAIISVAALGVALSARGHTHADPTEPRYTYTHTPKEGAMPPPLFQGEWCMISERAPGGGSGYRLCKNVPGGGTAKMVITGTAATLTTNGVVACGVVADLPDPFVANWYVHYDCGGKPYTMRYARMNDGNVPGLRVQFFVAGPVHNSFVNAERARKAVEEDYAAPQP